MDVAVDDFNPGYPDWHVQGCTMAGRFPNGTYWHSEIEGYPGKNVYAAKGVFERPLQTPSESSGAKDNHKYELYGLYGLFIVLLMCGFIVGMIKVLNHCLQRKYKYKKVIQMSEIESDGNTDQEENDDLMEENE